MSSILGKADKELKEKRRNICKGCEFYMKDAGLCGNCFCVVKLKTALAKSECPIGKW